MVNSERAPVEVINIDSDDEPEIKAQTKVESDSNNDATIIDPSSNRSVIELSTEINSAVPGQSSSSASRKKKKLIRSKFQCEGCCKSFADTSRLIYLRRIHLAGGLVHCRICLCGLSAIAERDAHQTKCNKKRYECYLCGNHQVWRSTLISHMAVHTGLRPFKCNICSTTYTKTSSLNIHTKLKH